MENKNLEEILVDSPEYEFCNKFLGIESEAEYQPEFQKRFSDSPNGILNWDFWTGQKSYQSALKKMMVNIPELEPEDAKILYLLAHQIVWHRGHDLDKQKEVEGLKVDPNLQDVYNCWTDIEQKLLQKLQNPELVESLSIIILVFLTAVLGSFGFYCYAQVTGSA